MRLGIGPAVAIAIISLGTGAWGQYAATPGQLATAPDLHAVSTPPLAEAISAVPPRVEVVTTEPRHDHILNSIWIGSMAAMVGATALDAGTSWGKHEANGFLASQDGTFGAKGLTIKAGIAAGTIIPEILLRRHKGAKLASIVANFSEAAIFSAVSVHNLGVPAPPQ